MDTNALMLPIEHEVRVFEELDRLFPNPEPLVPRAVLAELDELAGSHGEEATAASVGRDLADRCRPVDHDDESADNACVELASENACEFVCTNDRSLRDRLLETGTPVVGARGTDTLAVTEP